MDTHWGSSPNTENQGAGLIDRGIQGLQSPPTYMRERSSSTQNAPEAVPPPSLEWIDNGIAPYTANRGRYQAPEVVPSPTLEKVDDDVAQFTNHQAHGHYQNPAVIGHQQQLEAYWPQENQYQRPYDAVSSQYAASMPSNSAPPLLPGSQSGSPDEDRICGIRRKLFLLLLGLGGLVLLGIAIGVGVGIGLGAQENPAPPAATTSLATPSESTTTTPASTTVVFPTSATAVAACPGPDKTGYLATNGKKFIHFCGIDYSGQGEATDIGYARTANFTACIEKCAQRSDCTGVGWTPNSLESQWDRTCWMKKGLGKSHGALGDFNFAILMAD